MRFDEFVQEITGSILDYLPEHYKDAKVEIVKQEKINQTYQGMVILQEGVMATPIVNLDQLFKDYQTSMLSVEEIMENTAKQIKSFPGGLDIEYLKNYNALKERLFIRVCDSARNHDFLTKVPHTNMDSLAVTYHVVVDRNKKDGYLGSVPIHNDMLKEYGVSLEQLHRDATENSKKMFPPVITSLNDFFGDIERQMMEAAGMDQDDIDLVYGGMNWEFDSPFYMITNTDQINGAASLFYPDMMDEVSKKMEGGYYIVPSSIHEFLLVSEQEAAGVDILQNTVKEVNKYYVEPDIQLGSDIFHYDPVERAFEKAAAYEERQRNKETGHDLEHRKPVKTSEQEKKQSEKGMKLSL